MPDYYLYFISCEPSFISHKTRCKANKRVKDYSKRGYKVVKLEAEQGMFLKVGISKNIERRLKELQTGNPMPITLRGFIPLGSEKAKAFNLESGAQAMLTEAGHRSHGEWFSIRFSDDGQRLIDKVCDHLSLDYFYTVKKGKETQVYTRRFLKQVEAARSA